jgi:inner membrane transporter RhtA
MMRVSLAALILMIIWKPWKIAWTKKNMTVFLCYGISLGGMNLLFYLSLARIPLGIAVALEFTGPLTLALLSSRKSLDFCWALLAALGIWFILPLHQNVSGGTGLDPLGIILAILAGVCWAFYILFGKASGKLGHSGHATAMGMFFAALVTIPFGLAINAKEVFHLALLPMALFIAILSSALPYSLEMMAMKNIPSKTFGILMSMEPAVAAMMGFFFLREKLSTLQLSAIVCIILASAGTTLTSKN